MYPIFLFSKKVIVFIKKACFFYKSMVLYMCRKEVEIYDRQNKKIED